MGLECAGTKKLMVEYADGRLSGTARGMFESHMEGCPGCREEYEDARRVRALFAGAPRFSAPAGFSARVMRNLDSGLCRKRRTFLPGGLFMKTAEAALILVVIVAGILSGNFLAADLFRRARDTGAAASRSVTSLTYSMDAFDPAPPDSVGAVFVSMEDGNEK